MKKIDDKSIEILARRVNVLVKTNNRLVLELQRFASQSKEEKEGFDQSITRLNEELNVDVEEAIKEAEEKRKLAEQKANLAKEETQVAKQETQIAKQETQIEKQKESLFQSETLDKIQAAEKSLITIEEEKKELEILSEARRKFKFWLLLALPILVPISFLLGDLIDLLD